MFSKRNGTTGVSSHLVVRQTHEIKVLRTLFRILLRPSEENVGGYHLPNVLADESVAGKSKVGNSLFCVVHQ